MFNRQNFVTCIGEQLERKGFGKKKADDIIARFNGLADNYRAQGVADAETRAMLQVFSEQADTAAEKAKRAMVDLLKRGEIEDRFANFMQNTKVFGEGENAAAGPGRIAISFIEDDPRSGGLSYSTNRETANGQLWAVGGDVLENIGKGALGRQKGTAHLDNVVREAFGANTGDSVAKEVAAAWRKMTDASIDLMNRSGGSVKKLSDWALPQGQNAVKLIREGFEAWAEVHNRTLDWGKMAWPDGSPIKVEQRADVLKQVYKTLSTGGANKIEPGAFNGRGAAVGNMMEQHRFLRYKDGDAWLEVHKRFSDGNVFDVMTSHVSDMAHKIALVQTFGSNPSHMADTIRAVALQKAAELDNSDLSPKKGRSAVSETEALLKNKFSPMLEQVTRANPMDPDSLAGNLVVGTANILTSAQLGAAALLAIPGDFVTAAAVKAFNKMPVFGGVDFYFKTLATDRAFMEKIATQSGFVFDEVSQAVYAQQRFTGLNTVGPQFTKRVADTVLRASLLSGHTKAARWASQAEFMGLLNNSRNTPFAELPFKEVMQRYGITAEQWDAVRENVQPWSPRADVNFLRPIDILQTKVKDADALYQRFQGMILEESRKMVPEGTIEGSVTLKDTTRPDTLPGAVLYSFAMYKNFPVSMMMTYGRLAMSNPDRQGRLALVAGLGVGMTLVGAMGTQMREIAKGRDPLPMNTPAFWGKALLSGGAMSIYGDFLFAGVNQFGRGPGEAIAGPLAGFMGDTAQLVFGDAFSFADALGGLKDQKDSKTLSKLVEYARRYTPGSSLWYARAALERQVFDRLAEVADPTAYRSFQRRRDKQRRDFGNDYYWAPGDRLPDRLPQF